MIGVLHHLDDRQAVDALQTAAVLLALLADSYLSTQPSPTGNTRLAAS